MFVFALFIAFMLRTVITAAGIWGVAKVLHFEGLLPTDMSFIGAMWVSILMTFIGPLIVRDSKPTQTEVED